MKIAFVVCYDQDHVRAKTLRTALESTSDVQIIDIRNHKRGLKRYPEVAFKILRARFQDKPDAYFVPFRGYEMFAYLVVSLVRKPIIFDEMVNATEYLDEQGKHKPGSWQYGLFRYLYGKIASRARFILADTDAHAAYSAELNRLPLSKYKTVAVATDETVFTDHFTDVEQSTPFTVLYYGHMLPLHGLNYVLEAARLLKANPSITFRVVGGKDKAAQAVAAAVADGAHVTHELWVPFEELPKAIMSAGITIGGPLGDTLQSQFVITTKTYSCLLLGAPVLIGANKVNDIFQDKLNALVVPQANAQAIVEAVVWGQSHPAELRAVGLKGQELYRERLSQAVVNQEVGAIIAELRS